MDNYKILNSNKYKKGMKWLQVPENRIDTVIFNPISNTFTEGVLVAEETFDTVTVSGSSIHLPCSTSASIDISNPSYNYYDGWGGLLCKGNAFMKKARITHTFMLEDPVSGTPVVNIILKGKTVYTSRGTIGFGTMPSYDAASSDVANFIYANKEGEQDWEGDSNIKIYSDQVVDVCPWVRKARGSGVSTSDNIITRWHGQPQSGLLYTQDNPNGSDWNVYNTPGRISVYPDPYYPPIDYPDADPKAYLLPKGFSFVRSITRINGRTFSIDIEIPILFIYTAASRMGSPSAGDHRPLIDSFAAYDLIKEVKVELIGTTLDSSTTTRSYSLDENGDLTDNAKNNAPFTFQSNSLITLGTMYGLSNWMESMAKYILDEYKYGKYIIEAEVSAEWIIKQNITINSLLKVKDLYGNFIVRNERVCLFEVKTIEKRYKGNEFVYAIKMLESPITSVYIGGIAAIYNYANEDFVNVNDVNKYLYFKSTNSRLVATATEETAISEASVMGCGVALVSQSTLPGPFFLVPGDNIGRKVLAIVQLKSEDISGYIVFEFYLYNTLNNNKITKRTYYYKRNTQKQSDYYVFLFGLENLSTPYKPYIKLYRQGGGNIYVKSIQLYNAGNANLTEQEAYDWLVANNKLL